MIELDHVIVPARDRVAAARRLAGLLGLPSDDTALGVFSPVYVNAGLTLLFADHDTGFPIEHFCFRVGEQEFDAVLGRLRAAGIGWRATVAGPNDGRIGHANGGRGIYWDEPDGHRWEILTASYARQPGE